MSKDRIAGLTNLEGEITVDGKHVVLQFKNSEGGSFEAALGTKELGRTIWYIIELARKAAEIAKPALTGEAEIEANPIDVAAIAVAPGRTDREALLAIPVGPLTLTFALPVSTLLETLENLRSMTVKAEPERRH